MQIAYLPEPERHRLWGEMLRLLEPAEFDRLHDNELVWIAFEGPLLFGVATTILDRDEAQIRCVAGKQFKDWGRQMEMALEAWARDCGAARLTALGRMGWARLYRAFGWDCLGTDDEGKLIFKKEL